MDVQAIEPGTDFAHAIFRAFKRSMSGMRVSVPMPGGWPKRSSRSWPRRLPPLPGVRPGCPAHIRERESTCVDQCGGPGKGRRLLGDMPIAQSTPVEGIDRTLTGLLSALVEPWDLPNEPRGVFPLVLGIWPRRGVKSPALPGLGDGRMSARQDAQRPDIRAPCCPDLSGR
jgi:hypothetical protein